MLASTTTYWLDTVEEELAYTSKETKNVSIVESSSLFVTHCNLELIKPYTRVNG